MVRTFLRTSAALALAAVIGGAPALADPMGMFGSAVSGANAAIKNAENTQAKRGDRVAQVPPVTQQPVGGPRPLGLPTGFTYTADLSIAYPFGNIGSFGKAWPPGGTDIVAGYGFNPTTRFVANFYQLQHYPVGFNSGQVPLFLPSAFPITPGVNPSCVDLSGASSPTCAGIKPPIDVTTKDSFILLNFEKLFTLGNFKGRSLPIVITPTYVSRWSHVAASNGNGDVVGFVDSTGVPHTDIHTRTAQYYSLAVTLPFLKTPKMFGTFTVAPTWLVHLAGITQQNHAQLYQILYLEYTPTKTMRIFFEPQSSRDYLPADFYAQHLPAYFLGISQGVGKIGFIQLVLNSGGPTNYSPYGVKQLNCFALPCSSNTLPQVGGLKATQLQIQFGIGSPSVIQF
ncbi:MAG: hypothetical protein JO146_04685 [Candidatus Eremiobacteraeota bacterium]|nr:hypothetical protein [Candidatus Eremiobacteraeota bacterium]